MVNSVLIIQSLDFIEIDLLFDNCPCETCQVMGFLVAEAHLTQLFNIHMSQMSRARKRMKQTIPCFDGRPASFCQAVQQAYAYCEG